MTTFIMFRHGIKCPGAWGDPAHCCCDPEVEKLTDAQLTERRADARRAAVLAI